MSLAFTKMHGLGNDFMVFEAQQEAALPDTARWRALADRRTGIGFDQALVILPPRTPDTTAYYRIFNADGGEVEQCGNGVRCVAEWLRQNGRGSERPLRLESRGGLIEARFIAPGTVEVNMGEPRFATPARNHLQLDSVEIAYTEVSMGNPHIVLEVEDVDTAPVAELGPRLESHPRFPARTNVGFLQIVDREHAKLRVFERGVGETRACGTGACAAMAAGRRAGAFDERVTITLPGGALSLYWPGAGAPLWMTGPAVVSFRGEIGD
ncbi:MAG: diaminopimelate epimerase [Gammaproteobacteria bacterium]|nr:diaminopimelate epimerase [Gammaproteobacteria bacterium]